MNDNGNPAMTSLETDMAEVETMIGNARRAMLAGEIMDLSPLGDRISVLCNGIRGMALTSSDPEAIQRRLQAMVIELTQLEDFIRATTEQVEETNANAGSSPAAIKDEG